MAPGLYDILVTQALHERLERLPAAMEARTAAPEPAEAHEYLARQAAGTLREVLRLAEEEGSERLRAQARACNAALIATGYDVGPALFSDPPRLLTEVRLRHGGDMPRPVIPLSTSALLVNDDERLSAAGVLKREVASSDSVDLICAFVNHTGVRILEDEVRALCERGRMRLITTTYLGATQRRALDALAHWGVEIRVTYERPPANTRLHAKAWLFRRRTGYDTAMIGSSNLSHTALMDGLEWNVRLSRVETPQVLSRFRSTFDRYWDDPAFEAYDPAADGERLEEALRRCGGREEGVAARFHLDVRPLPHQVDILEALAADRARGHSRNLIVCATGTGKTIAAALDYRRQCADGRQPSLLFVAHRREILAQSLDAFRAVMRDGSFGELWTGGRRPAEGRHVFASIQALHSTALGTIGPEQFEMAIVDEFHHAEATTYRRLLEHIRPSVLVGLTATPERTDGTNVMRFFGNRATYEMRLWDALEDQLLCPFQYFGIADNLDLSAVAWSRGRYEGAALEEAYLRRGKEGAALVLEWIGRIVTDWRAMRALGFCVSVRHAEMMAEQFRSHGVPSVALTSAAPEDTRGAAIRRLTNREVNVIFTVDLFNEGIDIPEADTLLFLRPTESATVFLQQLGRGLRLCQNKPCATVLDFVGQQNRGFRFDQRFRALTGLSRTALEQQLQHGFTSLPSGCHIQLDRLTRERVLVNVRAALPTRTPQLEAEYRALSGGRRDYPLAEFVRETGIGLDDLYRADRTLTAIKRRCGVLPTQRPTDEGPFSRALGRLLHAVDAERLVMVAGVLEQSAPPRTATLGTRRMRELYMLAHALAPDLTLDNLQEALARLWNLDDLRGEVAELLRLLADRCPPGARTLSAPGAEEVPLCTHGVYSQDEVMCAFGLRDPSSMRQGVRHFPEARCDVLLVTLRKTETDYSPTTRYDDYPISPALFHWESQNAAGPETAVGRRYIEHAARGSTVLLFVRESRTAEGRTSPYLCCGPVEYVSHESARPMRITWRLLTPMPHRRFQEFRAVAG